MGNKSLLNSLLPDTPSDMPDRLIDMSSSYLTDTPSNMSPNYLTDTPSDMSPNYLTDTPSDMSPNYLTDTPSDMSPNYLTDTLSDMQDNPLPEYTGNESIDDECLQNKYTRIYFTDETKIYCRKMSETKEKRIYEHVHFCYYCHKKLKKVSEHLKRIHSNELRVIEYAKHPPNSIEANCLLTVLRNMGDNQHNRRVVKARSGELILPRSPIEGTNLSDFTVCVYCFSWVRDLKKHLSVPKRCKAPGDKFFPKSKVAVVSTASKNFQQEVIEKFRKDEIVSVIKGDKMLIQLGNDTIAKNQGNKLKRGSYTSNKVRLCAKVYQAIKLSNHSEIDLYGYLTPVYYDLFVNSVKSLCNLSNEDYKSPTTAIKAGQHLVELCDIKKEMATKASNEVDRRNAKYLKGHIQSRWHTDVTAIAYSNINERRYNKRVKLPLPEDLHTLSRFLEQLTTNARKPTLYVNFKNIVQIVQARLVLYNKRRPGEIDGIR